MHFQQPQQASCLSIQFFENNMFGKKDKESTENSTPKEGTEPITQPFPTPGDTGAIVKDAAPYQVGSSSSIGMQREINEDALFTLSLNLVSNNTNLPLGLYIVADGMGGHQHGERASNVAVRAMADQILSKVLPQILEDFSETPSESIGEIMETGIHSAHQAIIHHAPGGGTTLTGMLLLGEKITICHIGDSRAYKINQQGEMQQLTTDHSVVRRLEELGQITSDEAAIHPQRNVLYRALGQTESVNAEIFSTPIQKGGYYLICSDGLWGLVPEVEMKKVIAASDSPQMASEELIRLANEAGGSDNISVILVKLPA
jgi:serine/threonine protein phosphatase PrpC